MKKSTIIIMFFIGLIILVYPHIAQLTNNELQKSQVSDFKRTERSGEEVEDIITKATKYNQKIYHDRNGFRDPFIDDDGKNQKFKDYMELYDGNIFAVIEIPKLKLNIPIFLGATDEILSEGIGQIKGSSIPIGGKNTHTILSGHRGMGTKEMFRNIDRLQPQDEFYIHGKTGTLKYRVTSQSVIYPDQTSELEIQEDKDIATLFTCHPYRHNYQRLLIHGERFE